MFEDFFGTAYRIFIIDEGYKLMLSGLRNTLIIALFALIIGVVIGSLFAIMKVIPGNKWYNKLLRAIANVYITIIRGTPVIVQLFIAYFVIGKYLPTLDLGEIFTKELLIAIVVFGLNSAGYVAEIVRSGIMAVDAGQTEASRSLGLTYGATMRKIIFPQAIKNILPALGNELIVLIKETSVASVITVFDLTKGARSLVSTTYNTAVPYLFLAATYLVIVMIATFFVNLLEKRLRASDKR